MSENFVIHEDESRTLECVACGASWWLPAGLGRGWCPVCGTRHLVVPMAPIARSVKGVRVRDGRHLMAQEE